MKNIIFSVLVVFVLSSATLPIQAFAIGSTDTQTNLLIQLLLEKVKGLQIELENLLKAKSEPIQVEIVSQNTDYQKEVNPLVDLLEEKNSKKKQLEIKLEESKCIKPFRMISREGVYSFNCSEKLFHYATSTVTYNLSDSDVVDRLDRKFNDSTLSQKFGMRIIGVQVYGAGWSEKGGGVYSPARVVIPPVAPSKMIDLSEEIEVIDKEIAKIEENITKLKLRYGI